MSDADDLALAAGIEMVRAFAAPSCPVYAYVLDRDLNYRYLNPTALRVGYGDRSVGEVVGRGGREFFPTVDGRSDMDDLEFNAHLVMRRRTSVQVIEVLMGRAMLSVKWPLLDERGEVCGVAGVSIDITDSVAERVRGDSRDRELLTEILQSTGRMTRAMCSFDDLRVRESRRRS